MEYAAAVITEDVIPPFPLSNEFISHKASIFIFDVDWFFENDQSGSHLHLMSQQFELCK